jgi:hypothetical protein
MNTMPPMLPPPLTPGDEAQLAMTAQMQQFMQMQMQFMQMMTAGGTPSQAGSGVQSPGMQPPGPGHRASTPNLLSPASARPGSAMMPQRAMSSLDPNAAPWGRQSIMPGGLVQHAGYAPSLAPSERSNVGHPGRYRPVSVFRERGEASRTSTMSGAQPDGWNENLRTEAPKVQPEDEDEEQQAWEKMKAKRDKKRSLWRDKRSMIDLKKTGVMDFM